MEVRQLLINREEYYRSKSIEKYVRCSSPLAKRNKKNKLFYAAQMLQHGDRQMAHGGS